MRYLGEDFVVNIDEGVVALFKHYKQTGKKGEQGGILLGYKEGNQINIKKASIPTSYDRSSRFNFVRDKKSAQLFIDYEYFNTKGKITYIGEWHTHPENTAQPSSIDVSMIKKQFEKNKINEEFLIMIIVGLKNNYLGYYNGKTLVELFIDG